MTAEAEYEYEMREGACTMPQMNKGSKFVFGKSRIRDDLAVRLSPQAVAEYDIVCEGRVTCSPAARALTASV